MSDQIPPRRTGFFSRTEVRLAGATAIACALALILLLSGATPLAEIRIAAGFLLFFVAPGLLFILAFFPGQRPHYLEIYPAAIAVSLGVWAFPGLISYLFDLRLGAVAVIELIILAALLAGAVFRSAFFARPKVPDAADAAAPGHAVVVAVIVAIIAALAARVGAFRGLLIDWDYFNYISHVNKLVAWDHASIRHFAYADAPPDPIHSYNIWALQWALIAKLFRIGAVELYIKSAFLTAPAAALAFYSLARRVFNANVARAGLVLFAGHQIVFGGMLFLGLTTFFPADSQWLVVFPAAAALFFLHLESPKSPGLALAVALAALGMSITHVLWGLAFYLVVFAFLLANFLRWLKPTWSAARGLGRASVFIGAAAWFSIPLVLAAVKAGMMLTSADPDPRAPLLGEDPGLAPWPYFIVFVAVPAGFAIWILIRIKRPRPEPAPPELGRALVIAALCLAIALPYAYLRYEAIQNTNWAQFGRNPYQAFITTAAFFLNPFSRSLADPNLTFYPLYILSYACLPFIWRAGRQFPNARAAWAILIIVPLICFHPAVATLFAHLFSLGYLRRLLRVAGTFSYLPLALGLHLLVARFRDPRSHPLQALALTLAAAAAVSAACIPLRSDPPYFTRIAWKTRYIMDNYPRDSLLADDSIFQVMAEHKWFGRDDVIFSDMWTSFRLTAYLPSYVAVQHKPGVGVPDQDERMQLMFDFFDQRNSEDRQRQILERLHATGVVINRNPAYAMGGRISCSYPEAITRLKSDPAHFELLYDQGDWGVFRVKKADR